MAKDVICGMDVNESEAAGVSDYKGKKYYFVVFGLWIIGSLLFFYVAKAVPFLSGFAG